MHVTVGNYYWAGKIVNVECRKNGDLKHIDNKGESFLMVVLLNGRLLFRIRGRKYQAEAPCFLCFDEQEAPEFDEVETSEYYRIYFHPVFLNINMTFEFIRSKQYEDIAQAHNLFLLRPFLEENYMVPMSAEFLDKMRVACENLEQESDRQSDWYWSCRCRSYFMEIMMALERQNSLYEKAGAQRQNISRINSMKLQKAVEFIDGHYNEPITLKEVVGHCGLNHTTLNLLFKQEMHMTVMKYITNCRIKAARKHLAFTDLPLKEIADRCGFKTVPHFSRVFKEVTGETPIAFRRAALEKRKKEL